MKRTDSGVPVLLRWRDSLNRAVASFLARHTAVLNRYVERQYAGLFYSLLLSFVVSPFLAALNVGTTPVQLLLAVNLMLAVVPIRARNLRRTLILLVVAALAIRFLAGYFGQAFSSALLVWAPVGLLVAGYALRSTLRAKSVESEHIYAALSAYLLAGISFGVFYWALERTWPGSMLYGGVPTSLSQSEGIYFSFVTLATLGYGDFVPKSELLRGMAILEAVAGQLYLGVMVARLVSLYVAGASQMKRPDTEDSDLKTATKKPH
jgi:hypothetical protein